MPVRGVRQLNAMFYKRIADNASGAMTCLIAHIHFASTWVENFRGIDECRQNPLSRLIRYETLCPIHHAKIKQFPRSISPDPNRFISNSDHNPDPQNPSFRRGGTRFPLLRFPDGQFRRDTSNNARSIKRLAPFV